MKNQIDHKNTRQTPNATLNRRDFFKTFAVAAGGFLLPGMPAINSDQGASIPAQFAWRLPVRLGLLLPTNSVYPGLGDQLLSGVRLALGQERYHPHLISQAIRPGYQDALQQITAWLEEKQTDLIIAYCNPETAGRLAQVADQYQKILILIEAGARIPSHASHYPNIFYNTLNDWQANYAMGTWTAKTVGKRGFLVASQYDSGFDSMYAFQSGFEIAGGQLSGSLLSHLQTADNQLDQVISAIRQARPEFVYALYSGAAATEFLAAYQRAGLDKTIPLMGNAFFADFVGAQPARTATMNIPSARAWAHSLPASKNQDFIKGYQKEYSQNPSVFSMLGYETAQIVQQALAAVGTINTDALRNTLESLSFSGPRGPLQMDKRTHHWASALYLSRLQTGSADKPN